MSSACDKRLFAAVKRNDCEAVLTALREKANPNSVWARPRCPRPYRI